ncbi:biotin--[acetyl-CoA-carboxylase] ligase, partial [Candidatus Bipolaricaulota bacterium]|nr:biotin--[acetyl-CoA-carboxylase] ligase [Candidatus Bipolaricaulota bacterium]
MNGKIHTIGRTSSTQHIARRLIEQGLASMGDAVVADEQTTGQGRFGRSWISPRGGLYATIILPSGPLLSLKAGLALVRALRRAGVSAGLKWPNDVLVEDRKIAGVLVEAAEEHSLVGIGLNLISSPLDSSTCVSH